MSVSTHENYIIFLKFIIYINNNIRVDDICTM